MNLKCLLSGSTLAGNIKFFKLQSNFLYAVLTVAIIINSSLD